jgi:hypothetical protein
MYHVVFAHIIHAERERELEEAIRRRQLLKPQDETVEPPEAVDRRGRDGRSLTQRVRPTGGW